MIGIDTNIIVRSLTGDDVVQSPIANQFLERLTEQTPGFICREVVIELVWVLERVYKLPKATIGNAILELANSIEIVVENDLATTHAAHRYMQGGADFADLMILAAADDQRATPLYTFDRKLAHIDGATLLSDI